MSDMVHIVVRLSEECNGEKSVDSVRAFSSREAARKCLHESYLDDRLWADCGAGEFDADYSDEVAPGNGDGPLEGSYEVVDEDGDLREGKMFSAEVEKEFNGGEDDGE